MKLTAINIFSDYHRIKRTVPSYRLGQHYCNVMGLENTIISGVDLFTCTNDVLSDKLFYQLCNDNQWCVFDLPKFSTYDLTTIKPY